MYKFLCVLMLLIGCLSADTLSIDYMLSSISKNARLDLKANSKIIFKSNDEVFLMMGTFLVDRATQLKSIKFIPTNDQVSVVNPKKDSKVVSPSLTVKANKHVLSLGNEMSYSNVKIDILNLKGQCITKVYEGKRTLDNLYELNMNVSGRYIIRIECDNNVITKSITVI